MTIFCKAAAVVILTVILGSVIAKTDRDISTVLTVLTCCMMIVAGLEYLSDVVSFLLTISKKLEDQMSYLPALLKISAVALISEVTGQIGSDAGYSSLNKAIQFLANAVMLSLSLPLFETFIITIQELLGIV